MIKMESKHEFMHVIDISYRAKMNVHIDSRKKIEVFCTVWQIVALFFAFFFSLPHFTFDHMGLHVQFCNRFDFFPSIWFRFSSKFVQNLQFNQSEFISFQLVIYFYTFKSSAIFFFFFIQPIFFQFFRKIEQLWLTISTVYNSIKCDTVDVVLIFDRKLSQFCKS